MRTGKRLVHGWVIGISMFICLAGLLAHPSDSQAAAYSILHNFAGGADDGFQPYFGGPVLSGSTLYGMTQGGRTGPGPPPYHYEGTLYRINTDGSGYQILHDFGYPPDGFDGTSPRGSLALSGSTLYGFTTYGGGSNGGTVFKIDTSGSGYEILKRFSTATDQCNPYGPPVISGSRLYGMHSSESTGLKGAIFAMNLDGGGYQVLHEFVGKPNDGQAPYGSLTLVGSKLYGMTYTGGSGGIDGGGSGNGVIFKINTDGTRYKVLHHFGVAGYPNDESHPYGSLTLVGSKLYGMTSDGGPGGGGVIFSINPDGSEYQVLFDLNSASIAGPSGSLTLQGSRLYGMTRYGGPGGGSGAIFRVNTDGTGFQILHIFKPDQGDGGAPLGDVTFAGSRLYGWTYADGAYNCGVFFSYQPPQADTGMMQLLLLD
jgi:uncharacterized repeat protein (TIGR03803 family)